MKYITLLALIFFGSVALNAQFDDTKQDTICFAYGAIIDTISLDSAFPLGKDGLIDTIYAEHPKAHSRSYYWADMISKDVVIMPYVFDTTEAIICYADTSSYEIEIYTYKMQKFSERRRNQEILWKFGYETEGILLDEQKKPLSPNIIVINYQLLK